MLPPSPNQRISMELSKTATACILSSTLVLGACSNWVVGEALVSTSLKLEPSGNGFVATRRAGVDKLSNDPTWETIRRQELAEAVAKAGYCPKGIDSVERTAIPVRRLESGTSQDLVYRGKCK